MTWPLLSTFNRKRNAIAACLSELAAPILRRKLIGIVPPTHPLSWRKGLLVGANHIGDVLYRSSSLAQLKLGLPHCEWHFLAPEPACQLLVRNPAISKTYPFDIPASKKSDEYDALALENYDVLLCYNSGGYLPFLKLAVDLKIPNRAAYVHKGFSALTTHPVSIRYPQPFPAYFRDLVSEFTGTTNSASLCPVVYPSTQDEEEANALMSTLDITGRQDLLACFVTTRQPSGIWPSERYAQAVKILENRHPKLVTLLMGASSDEPLLKKLKQLYSLRAQVVAGKLGLMALVCFLKRCNAVLTTDSGPRHLANTAGTKPVFFRNLWFDPVEAGRYVETEVDIAPANIGLLAPEKQKLYFEQITPQDAADAVSKIINSQNL
ncbi:MAG: glycosyltransferase family 9 protein [Terrimicrobiaceae bacterium]